jgi:hypothetical protein
VQVALPLTAYSPSAQGWQASVAEPVLDKDVPAAQSVHIVWPVPVLYFPARHGEHAFTFFVFENCPVAQTLQLAWAAAASLNVMAVVASQYLPAAHSTGAHVFMLASVTYVNPVAAVQAWHTSAEVVHPLVHVPKNLPAAQAAAVHVAAVAEI